MSQENTPTRRYCEDCRFCEAPADGMAYARCGSPKAAPLAGGEHFVSRDFDKPGFASSQRVMADRCGPDANWFEAKPSAAEAA